MQPWVCAKFENLSANVGAKLPRDFSNHLIMLFMDFFSNIKFALTNSERRL